MFSVDQQQEAEVGRRNAVAHGKVPEEFYLQVIYLLASLLLPRKLLPREKYF